LIELQMVYRMARRGAFVGPLVVLGFFIWGGTEAGVSAAFGVGMALLNLFLSARIIGGVAESNQRLLLPAAMFAFMLGLGVLTACAFALQTLEIVTFKITGFVLIGSHLGLVLWEAARAYPVKNTSPADDALRARS